MQSRLRLVKERSGRSIRSLAVVVVVLFGAAVTTIALSAPRSSAQAATLGGWTVTPSPAPGTQYGALLGVSCFSSTHCMAVGGTDTSTTQAALAEIWNGNIWSVTPVPNASQSFLYGVSCPSSTDCVAVGFASGGALIVTWNGGAWSIVHSPVVANSVLYGVSCLTSTWCVAVGQGAGTLVESWNGIKWSVIPSPNNTGSRLLRVSCLDTSSCMAVGDSASPLGTLTESWNGSSWSIVPSPNVANMGNELVGVSCTKRTFCVAAGLTGNTNGDDKALLETWNGSRWYITNRPYAKGTRSYLQGVSCTESVDCVGVGLNGSATLIEARSGSGWSLVSSPSPGSFGNSLYDVSCVSAGCVAVGFQSFTSSSYQPLIETDMAQGG